MATATRPELTDRQRQMLDFIRSSVDTRGFPPSLREIGEALDIRSPNGVVCHIRALSRKGYLIHWKDTARGLRLIDDRPPDRLAASHAELLACCLEALDVPGPMGPGLRTRMADAVERAGEAC